MGELKRQRQNLENNCRGRERIKKKKKKNHLTNRATGYGSFLLRSHASRKTREEHLKVLQEKHLLT